MLSGAFPAIDVVRLFAIVFIAICLVPAGGHLAEIPNKIALPPGECMIVQKIYRGWALFGVVVFGALAFTLVHTMMVWREPIPRGLSLQPFLALAPRLGTMFASIAVASCLPWSAHWAKLYDLSLGLTSSGPV